MKHLNAAELSDVLEGRTDPRLSAHAHECEACRARLVSASETLQAAAQIEVPEPSPLFWDHLSARVGEAIAHAEERRQSWTPDLSVARLAFASATLTLVAAAFAGMFLIQSLRPPEPNVPEDTAGMSTPRQLDLAVDDTEWALIAEVADGMEWDEVAEVGAQSRVSSVDSLAATLSDEERAELARLIRDEIERAKS